MSELIQSIIFGFGHRARTGKDEATKIILAERGYMYDIKRYAFAQELKREVVECALKSGGMLNLFSDGLRDEGCGYLQENGNIIALPDWVQFDPNPPMDDPDCPLGKQRTLLQWWGTEYRRNVNPDYWVSRVAARIAKEQPEIALISDMRFHNEVAFCQKYGNAIRIDRPSATTVNPHTSELVLANFEGWDYTILNNGTLETFKDDVLFTFDSLMTAEPKGQLQ